MKFPYIVVGGGLAAAGAIEGIREHDRDSPILLMSRENHRPYQRPALSKDLWFGKTTLDKIPYHDETFYTEKHVEVALRREAVELDPEKRRVWDDHGTMHEYGRLLLATGGFPRRMNIPGGDSASISYYRYLEDYLTLRERIDRLGHILVIGGGFIGMEIAAALRHAGKDVTLLYPEPWPLARVLPRDLGSFVADYYRQQGVEAVSEETVVRFEDHGPEITAYTASGNMVTTQLVVAGIGITPTVDLAEAAGLEVGNGIEVDEHGRTSDPYIYAAGDVAEFPYLALDRRTRIEHWDHAIQHGKAAGANMAGANKPYDHLPFFYSDLFDLGWEAVGEIDSELETHAVWKQEYREGIVYYLRDEVVRGVLLWNTWNAVDWARGLIREAKTLTREEREAAVPA
ncbi:MAG TPA: FAD-dependent oxidoreductase [Candidatus Eisenbacteria bacterium]|nr:FAD-dependent oxidoreductase [Candidatus Eisenbacteria bacterium]